MALSQMQKMQAQFVIKTLEGQNMEDRAEFFKMIAARFCLKCGMEVDPSSSYPGCRACGAGKVFP